VVPAVLSREGHQLGCFKTVNLAAGGALLLGAAPGAVGDRLDIELRLSEQQTVSLRAVLVRTEGAGEHAAFALAFVDVPADAQDDIQAALLAALEAAQAASALIVDDASESCLELQSDLGVLGHGAFLVNTAEDAVRFLERQNHVSPALVEQNACVRDGVDVLAYLAAERPAIRRVLVSEAVASSQLARALAPYAHPLAHAVLPRPWTRETLAHAVGGQASGR
jgi:CheY-like chemotaxis protein